MMMFTCTHVDETTKISCNTKSAKTFSKDSYNKGVVLVRCDGCNSLHLVADNMGWFEDDGVNRGRKINVESLLRDKGVKVHKYISDESIEFIEKNPLSGINT